MRYDGLPAQVTLCVLFALYAGVRLAWFTYYPSAYAPDGFYDWFRRICLICFVVRELIFGRHDFRSLVLFAICVFMAYAAWESQWTKLAETTLVLFFVRDADLKPLACIILVEVVMVFAAAVAGVHTGLIADVVYAAAENRLERHSLGFGHPNLAMAYAIAAVAMWAYLRDERYGWWDAAGAVLVLLLVYSPTQSRTGFAVGVMLVVLMLVRRYVPAGVRAKLPLAALGASFFVVVVGGVFVLIALYNPDIAWLDALDDMLVGRIKNPHNVIVQSGVSPLWQILPYGRGSITNHTTGALMEGSSGYVVDNVYARILVHQGGVFFAIAMALCLAAFWRAGRLRQGTLLIIMAVMTVYGLAEQYPSYIVFNVFLVELAAPFKAEGGREEAQPPEGEGPQGTSAEMLE